MLKNGPIKMVLAALVSGALIVAPMSAAFAASKNHRGGSGGHHASNNHGGSGQHSRNRSHRNYGNHSGGRYGNRSSHRSNNRSSYRSSYGYGYNYGYNPYYSYNSGYGYGYPYYSYRKHGHHGGGNDAALLVLGLGLGYVISEGVRSSRDSRDADYRNYPPSDGNWTGNARPASNRVYADEDAYDEVCLETKSYQQYIVIDGEEILAEGIACLQENGSWDLKGINLP